MAVGVSRRRVDAPAVELVARIDERRVPREADEVGEHVAGLDQLVGDLGRHAVAEEPRRDLLGPVVGAPDLLALGVVEPALEDRRSRRLRGRLGAADVVGVHVRDEDADDRAVELREDLVPRRLHQPEAGVDERPAVVSAQEVAVHVPGPARQRQGHAQDPRLELHGRCEHMFDTIGHRDVGRVSRRALPLCAQPGAGDGLRLVAQPVHGVRPPLHVLLCARVRAARRPAVGRSLRHEHPRQDERRRGAAPRARAAVVGSARSSRSAPRPIRTSRRRAGTS